MLLSGSKFGQTKEDKLDGEFKSFKQGDENCVVQNLARRFKEDAQLRLARIANGVDPKYKNGHPKHKEKTGR